MNDRRVPVPKKWPFYIADAILLAFACWILSHYPHPLSFGAASLMGGCVIIAAFLGVMPFRMEHQAAVKFAEAEGLADSLTTLRKLETLTEQIRTATGQWQGVQEQAGRTVNSSKEIADRIAAEAHSFAEFMQKANDSEKAALRLEVEKLRRGEGQWVQVLVHLLDHVFALYQAGARSGQPNLQEQLAHFQEACRDIARRVGLLPFEAAATEVFDGERHQVSEDQPTPLPEARVGQTLATGYTFQGRLVRRALVALQTEEVSAVDQAFASEELPPTEPGFGSEGLPATDPVFTSPAEFSAAETESLQTMAAEGFFPTESVSTTDIEGSESVRPSTSEEQEFRLESDPTNLTQRDDYRSA